MRAATGSGNGERPAPSALEAKIFQDFARAIVAGRAGDAASRVCAGTAQVQALQRRAVVGVSQYRSRRPELIERELAVEDVAPCEAEHSLQVGGGKRAMRDHAFPEARC